MAVSFGGKCVACCGWLAARQWATVRASALSKRTRVAAHGGAKLELEPLVAMSGVGEVVGIEGEKVGERPEEGRCPRMGGGRAMCW